MNYNKSLYSNLQSNKLVLINKNQNKKLNKKKNNNVNNMNKKKEFKININNEIHKEFFKNEEKKSSNNSNTNNTNNNSNSNNNNIRYSHNINNTETYFFLNETYIDLSKSTKNKSDNFFNNNNNNITSNNNIFTDTKGNKHISPINNFKTKRIFSSFCSKINKNMNINTTNTTNNFSSTYNVNKRPSVIIKNKNIIKKNKMKINVENILNTDNIYNKENKDIKNEVQTLSNKKHININKKNKNLKNNSFIDIQIPLVPEENIQVISLKTMKYNFCINSNQIILLKIKKIFRNDTIMNIILSFLTNNDLFNLSLVNNLCYKITKKIILQNIMYKIINNINDKTIINKIWNIELMKYSKFSDKNDFDSIYNNYLNISNKYDNDIIKDLLRTFPKDNSFNKGSEGYYKMFNILKAYSNYNNEIGYAQGMNFIVAKLIKFFKCEKKSFIYLDSLFNKLKMVNVIGVNNNLEKKMKIMEFLLEKLCPDIIKFLEIKKINHEIFSASWFITLFSKNFKNESILLIIWNFSIIFGWKFIFLFSISVVIAFKDKYSGLDLYDFTQYMKNIFIFEYFKKKFNDIMKLTFYYMSQWKNIIKEMEKEYTEDTRNKKIKKINVINKERKENLFNSFNIEFTYKGNEDTKTSI